MLVRCIFEFIIDFMLTAYSAEYLGNINVFAKKVSFVKLSSHKFLNRKLAFYFCVWQWAIRPPYTPSQMQSVITRRVRAC